MSGIKKAVVLIGGLAVVLVLSLAMMQVKLGEDSNSIVGYDIIGYGDSIGDDDYSKLLEERQNTLPKGYTDDHVKGSMVNQDDPYEPDYTHYKKLTPEQIKEFMDNKGSGIIYFGWVDCIYCYRIRQTVDFVLDDLGQDIYYVEIEDLHKEKGTVGQDILRTYNVVSTPTFLVYQDGEEVDRMSEDMQGELNYVDVLQWFRDSTKEVLSVE